MHGQCFKELEIKYTSQDYTSQCFELEQGNTHTKSDLLFKLGYPAAFEKCC